METENIVDYYLFELLGKAKTYITTTWSEKMSVNVMKVEKIYKLSYGEIKAYINNIGPK